MEDKQEPVRAMSGMTGQLGPPGKDIVIMIRLKHILTLTLLAAVLVGLGFVNADAAPISACVAGDIIAWDPGCPSSGLCTIKKDFTIGDGCVLDFGTRNVTIAPGAKLIIAGATVTLKAGNFTVFPGGLVDGTTTTVGGSFTVEATGDIAVQKGSTSAGRILVNGDGGGGSILLDAGGGITINGQLQAHNRGILASLGGAIKLRSGGDTWITSTGEVDPHGGKQAVGGSLVVTADGDVTIDSVKDSPVIDITGGDGGRISIVAGGDVTISRKINATGQGEEGSGGTVDIVAWGDVQINGQIQNNGTGGDWGGGDGGSVSISSGSGDITVSAEINACGGGLYGEGGGIELMARDSIYIQSAGKTAVESTGPEGFGGWIFFAAKRDITIDGKVQAGAGGGDGEINIEAGRDVRININGEVNARGMAAGSWGGSVDIQTGTVTPLDLTPNEEPTLTGDLTLTGTVDVSGRLCSDEWGCSSAGFVSVEACNITVVASGLIDATAPAEGEGGDGGDIILTGRNEITIGGSIYAMGGEDLDGSITLIHPVGTPPTVNPGSIVPFDPQGDSVPTPVCTGAAGDPRICLVPCPPCGNGTTEFPETCDDTTGTPVSCDGCSAFCREEDEDCDDANDCTVDSCDEVLGCLSLVLPDGTACLGDGNPCTDGVCNAGTCENSPVPDGLSCADGNVCNGNETCQSGTCTAGTPLNCNDGSVCTTDSCDAMTGCQNMPMANGTPCADSTVCNGNETCQGGACTAGTQLPNGSSCADGNVCNGDETCQSGTCTTGTPLNCSDGSACTTDSCNPVSGCAHAQVLDGTSCSDGNVCNGAETCQAGVCTAGTPPNCNDGNACTTDTCGPLAGCQHTPVANGTPCADGNVCNGYETCQGGTCLAGTPLDCNDGKDCTNDTCQPVSGCQNTPIPGCQTCGVDSDCADGNPCTSDECDPASGCQNTALANGSSCSDGDVCNGEETCQSGVCTSGTPLDCNDGNACTADSCDPVLGCSATPVPNGWSCADGNVCNGAESCQAGVCTAGTPLNCNDGNVCTTDSCNPVSGCAHALVLEGTSCSDGNLCNGAETCKSGACTAGAALDCNDGKACTTDSCNAIAGCQNTPAADGTSCADETLCNGNETCQSGTCTAGTPPNCNDANVCTTDTCGPITGCQNMPVANETPCADSTVCNGNETCQSGTCTAGTPLNCNDANVCATDSCDPMTGCQNIPVANGTSCADSTVCNGNETCREGVCTAGTPLNCNDGNVCTKDGCDPVLGCQATPVANGSSCTDGNACTTGDRCEQHGRCTGTPIAGCCLSEQDCDDGNLCTDDACDVTTHQCVNEQRTCETTDRCLVGACNLDDGKCQFASRVGFEFLDCLATHDAEDLAASIGGFAADLGPKETKRLAKFVAKVKKKIETASASGQGKKAARQLKMAQQQLKKFVKRLAKLTKKGKGDIAAALEMQATAIQVSLQEVQAQIS